MQDRVAINTMCDYICDTILVSRIRADIVEENGGCPICDKAPVLHSAVRLGQLSAGIGQSTGGKRIIACSVAAVKTSRLSQKMLPVQTKVILTNS